MRILFVHPPSSHSDDISLQSIKSSSPSLGLLQLASIARSLGHTVSFMDREFNVRNLVSFNPDLVAITAMTNEIMEAAIVGRFCKEENITTVLGGCHVTAEPYNTLIKYPEFDNIIEGEGEWKFIDFIGGDSTKFKTLDDFPDPAFDLIDWKKYKLSPFGCKKDKSIGLVTSRGCFGKCTFCSRKVFGNKFRSYSYLRLLEILRKIKDDFDITDFLFYDDLFTGDKHRLVNFCEFLIACGTPYTWSCCSRVDNLDLKTLRLMKRAGCWMIEYGIESGSQKILDLMKKNITLEKIEKSLKNTQSVGILSKGNFILGNIGETKETIEETIRFARKLPLDMMQHTFLAPLPGTDCYEKASEHGSFDKDWAKTNTFAINFVPNGMDKEELRWYSKIFMLSFYMNPLRIFRMFEKLSLKQIWNGLKTLVRIAR